MADYKGSLELREANRKHCAAYRARNLEARRRADREYARSIKQRRYETHKEWAQKNKDYLAEYTREWRKTAQGGNSKHTPPWANSFFIREIYSLAKLRTRLLGIPFEVDHIIPLNGKMVSGLHVENNLRIVPRAVNKAKGNHYAFWEQT